MRGDIRVRGGASYGLSANVQVRRGKMEQLGRALGFERLIGSENFNGVLVLDSRDAGSLSALTGRVQIDFENGDAQSVPLLAELNRIVPLMQLASTDITSGRMSARIGQGLLRIDDVLLNSEAFWIAGNGSASLSSGNLNLQESCRQGEVSRRGCRRLRFDVCLRFSFQKCFFLQSWITCSAIELCTFA